jgi:CHASE2 domain-containing sensor protein
VAVIESDKKKILNLSAWMLLSIVVLKYLYFTYKHLLPAKPPFTYLPAVLLIIILSIFFYKLYKTATTEKRFAILIMPITLLLLAVLTFFAEKYLLP